MDSVSQITPKKRSAPSWSTAAELVLDHPDCTAGELARHAGDECDRARLELLAALHLAVEQGALLIGPVRTCSVRQTLAATWVLSEPMTADHEPPESGLRNLEVLVHRAIYALQDAA